MSPHPGHLVTQNRQITLITGGSRRIGRAIAGEFAAHGHALGLVARDTAALEAAASELNRDYGVTVRTYALDVTSADAAARLRAAISADGLTVKYLVNNVGYWSLGSLAATDINDLGRVVATNVLLPLHPIKAFLPQVIAAGGGILNVGSLAGSLPTPTFAAYGASKSFLAALSVAMRHELKVQRIKVCVVQPGLVRTDFVRLNAMSLWYRMCASSPETVARVAYRGLLSGRSIVVPGMLTRILSFGIACLPRGITQGIFNAAAPG